MSTSAEWTGQSRTACPGSRLLARPYTQSGAWGIGGRKARRLLYDLKRAWPYQRGHRFRLDGLRQECEQARFLFPVPLTPGHGRERQGSRRPMVRADPNHLRRPASSQRRSARSLPVSGLGMFRFRVLADTPLFHVRGHVGCVCPSPAADGSTGAYTSVTLPAVRQRHLPKRGTLFFALRTPQRLDCHGSPDWPRKRSASPPSST